MVELGIVSKESGIEDIMRNQQSCKARKYEILKQGYRGIGSRRGRVPMWLEYLVDGRNGMNILKRDQQIIKVAISDFRNKSLMLVISIINRVLSDLYN